MRNWHTRVIKLTEAKDLLVVAIRNGNPNIYVGVIEGKIEFSALPDTPSKYDDYNYRSSNMHLYNEVGDKKIIYRERYDNIFYDEGLQLDVNELNTMTHTTSVAGIIGGKDVGDNVFGICPDIKIINSDDDFEVALLLSLVNEFTKGNINSLFYEKNIIIRDNENYNLLKNGTGYLNKDVKKLPLYAKSTTNNLSNKKCSIISCSFSLSSYSDSKPENMPKTVADFIFKELFAYGRDGRGVLVVFAAGNENINIDDSDLNSAYSSKTLIVAASKVSIDSNNMNLNNESRASYSNYGNRIDVCAPSCPVGKSEEDEIEIYAPTAINCGEIGDDNQVISATVLNKFSNTKLILDNKYDVIFVGQSIEIGNPLDLNHEVRFIIGVDTVQYPSNSTLRTKITLDQPLVFTKDTVTSANVNVCFFKKNVTKFSSSQLTLDNFNGIGNYQSPLQKAYLYSEDITNVNDFSIGMAVTIKNNLASGNVIDILEQINLSRLTNLKLVPSQITTKLIRRNSDSRDFKPDIESSLQGFFSGQQVYIIEENVKRHIKYVAGIRGASKMEFAQLSSETDSEGNPPISIYTIKSLAYGNMTSSFGGTSAAAPIVSGVAAILLSANNKLNSAEIKHILKSTVDKINLKESDFSGRWKDSNGNNISYSSASTLSQPTVIGNNEIFVSNTAFFNVNDAIEIDGNFKSIIENIIAPNTLVLQLGVTSVYSIGKNVKKGNFPERSKYYGAGRVNAKRAVQLALDWHNTTNPTQTVLKPRLEIADKIVGTTITAVPESEIVDSPDIWISQLVNSNTAPVAPFNKIDSSKNQYINIRVRNTGNRQSFKECDLRVFVAFTDDETPAFPFPTMWYDQTEVKLLAVKEIPIIPFGGETIIQVAWEDIASKWNADWNKLNNGKRKRTYILAHIAPFDGIATEVQTNNIRNNKQLTCKEIIVTHKVINNGQTSLPGNSLNITVGSEVIAKSYDLSLENILSTQIGDFKVKATITNNDTGQSIDEAIYKKIDDDTWDFETPPSSDWIQFYTAPTEIVGNHASYTNIKIPHTINVSDDHLKVKLEIVNVS